MDIKTEQENVKEIINECIDNTNNFDNLQIDTLSFALATLLFMNNKIKSMPSLLGDKVFMSSRDKMNNEVLKYSNALGLTRQQRIKLVSKVNDNADEDIMTLLEK